MLKIETIVESSRTSATESKTLKATPAYRSPRMIEVGKAADLLQGPFTNCNYRDATNQWCNPWGHE